MKKILVPLLVVIGIVLVGLVLFQPSVETVTTEGGVSFDKVVNNSKPGTPAEDDLSDYDFNFEQSTAKISLRKTIPDALPPSAVQYIKGV